MYRILLTGSGGFIGKHIKSQIEKNNIVFSPRSFELDLIDSDITTKYIIDNQINFIIHSASCGVRITKNDTLEDVAKPNFQIFNNLAKHVNINCPMITIGSGAEYDKSRSICKICEDEFGLSVPKDAYGYSKYLISKEIEKKSNILNLRLFGVYGFGEDKSRVTSCIINDNLNHKPICLNQNVLFDFIYIKDFCKIVEHFINNPSKERFINVVSGNSIEIIELAKIVNSISDYKSDIMFKNEGMNNEYTASNSKLLKEFPGVQFTTYNNSIKEMFEQMRLENSKYF